MVILINSISFGIILDSSTKHIVWDRAIPANIAGSRVDWYMPYIVMQFACQT